MTMEEMRDIDLRTVDRASLMPRPEIREQKDSAREKKMMDYLKDTGNPYCYLEGKTVVKLSFAETDRTAEDCMHEYFGGV